MTLVNRLSKYYKYCLYEEAKISAFSNLHKEDNIVVKLNGYEKIFHSYPTPYVVQEESSALTQVMLKQQVDKKKQLIYGYIFITGKLEDGTEIYTPLIYADCNLERVNGKLLVSVNADTVSFNIPALTQIVTTNEDRDFLIRELTQRDLSGALPLSEEVVKSIEDTLGDIIPALDVKGRLKDMTGNDYKVHLNRENAVILTTINKGLAGVISDLDLISQSPKSITDTSALKAINDDSEDVEVTTALDEIYDNVAPQLPTAVTLNRFLPAFNLDNSQEYVARVASTDLVTSITGGPGTGKSNTISAIATNYILNGKTVLVCSKMNSAVDVVYNKLSELSKYPYCVRTGGKEYRKQLSELVDNIVMNKYNTTVDDIRSKEVALEFINSKYDITEEYKTFCKFYDNELAEHHDLSHTYESETNIIKKFLLKDKVKKNNKYINKLKAKLADLQFQAVGSDEDKFTLMKRDIIRTVVKGTIAEVVDNQTLRRQLMLFGKALKKAELDKYNYFSTFKDLVSVLPCWCTTTVDVSSSIPPIAGLFDVVIIDEASQCDIATCLPLLYRAKRAVIVGDDKQLKYLSFLSNAVNSANLENNNLGKYSYICNYRENSMFDFANYFSTSGNVMLKTQYRGCPEIMGFSNEKFYNGNLINVGKSYYSNPLSVTYVNGSVAHDKSVNQAEATRIIEEIKDFIKTDKVEGRTTTIGVLSPFREQCKLLEKMLTNVFTLEELETHKIIVGTAHSFQGEERDVMLISWTVADNSPIQSFTFINNPNLFNVSITRGRQKVMNFVSTNNLPKGLLREYLEYCENANKVEQTPAEVV